MPQPAIHPFVTEDALILHRLKELEEFAVGARELERRVDTLSLSLASVERTTTEIQTEQRKNDERINQSLARLHARLDDTLRDRAREEGREEGRHEVRAQAVEEGRKIGHAEGVEQSRMRTWKVVAWSITATTAFGLLIVAALNFALN